MARALIELNDSSEAYKQVQLAAKADPTSGSAATAMGWIYAQKEDLAKAAQWMEYAVKLALADPDPRRLRHLATPARSARGGPRPVRGRRPSHAPLAERAHGRGQELLYLRGLIARHLKDHERAEGLFLAILKDSPGDGDASNQLALALAEQADQGKRQRALELAEEATGREILSRLTVRATLGWVYYRLGRVDDAERTDEPPCLAAGSAATPRITSPTCSPTGGD